MVQVPRSRTGPLPPLVEHVRRREAEGVLCRGGDRGLVLVSAPPGFGRTTLLASGVPDDRSRSTAWVRLEAEDRGPRRLCRAVLPAPAAFPAIPPGSRLPRSVVSRSTVAPGLLADLTGRSTASSGSRPAGTPCPWATSRAS